VKGRRNRVREAVMLLMGRIAARTKVLMGRIAARTKVLMGRIAARGRICVMLLQFRRTKLLLFRWIFY